MSAWEGRTVLVTGATGFIGSHLVEALLDRGAQVRAVGRSRQRFESVLGSRAHQVEFLEGDLASPVFSRVACEGMRAVFHLAAQVTGVEYNTKYPGTMLTQNIAIGLHVLDAAAHVGVERFLCVSSACVYPSRCTIPTPESEGFVGDPDPTNFGYGWAKRFLEVQARCYVQESGIKIAIVRPYNTYGPRDNFEWETSHAIPALIRKMVEGQDPIVVWGDGQQTRSFLYVSDLVDGMVLALERYAVGDPVNLGTDEEVTVADVVRTMIELSGSRARIVFDTSHPAGQARRNGNFTKARTQLGFLPQVALREGLRRTIAWYREHRARAAVSAGASQ